jgi:hypothetical protein
MVAAIAIRGRRDTNLMGFVPYVRMQPSNLWPQVIKNNSIGTFYSQTQHHFALAMYLGHQVIYMRVQDDATRIFLLMY